MDGADDVLPYEPDQALIEEVSQAAQGRIVVVKMARLVTLKRIPLFLQACRILLDEGYPLYVALMCYGKDRHKPPIASQFERLFAPAEGRMLYEVRCPLSILKRADLGVTASALEGLGLNVLEYQAEGVAVVCSNIPAHREMVRDGETGYMFETDDLPDLVRTMKRALDNPEARQEIGERGRKAAMRRRWSRSAAATVELYRKLLSP